MQVNKNRKWPHILIFCIALLLMLSGIVMVLRVFTQYGDVMLAQQDDQLYDLVYSAKRSLLGQVERCRTDLEYVTGRRGFLEAEELWRNGGGTDELLYRMQENLLGQNPLIISVLAITEGEVFLSSNQELSYRFPDAGTDTLRPCIAEDSTTYLAILHEKDDITYAALLDLVLLYRNVAGEVQAEDRERLLLMDAGEKLLIHSDWGKTRVSAIEGIEEGSYDEDELALMQACLASGEPVAASYICFDSVTMENYEARMAAIPVGANGFFVVGITADYDAMLRPMRMAGFRLLSYGGLAGLGILILLGWGIHIMQRNQKVLRELKLLQAKNEEMEKLSRKTQELSHHQRLETIGTMTSSIAHEFNNLLTPIMGYSMMTLEALLPEQEELYDNVLEIYNASRKAKNIISRLSELSRKNTSLTFRYVSPDELMEKVLSVAMPAKPGNVQVKMELSCRGLWLYGNETQLSQLILNLVLNAFQSMAQTGGTLTLTTAREGEEISFLVADTGPGIPEEVLPQIFDPFFTTKESGMGTGLGLAIAQQVADEHHGQILVESEMGKGTVFRAVFPICTGREEQEKE